MMGAKKQGKLLSEYQLYSHINIIILQNNLYSTKWRQNLHDSYKYKITI